MIPGLPPLKVLETITLGADADTVRLPASGNIADHANFPSGSRHVVVLVNAIEDSGSGNSTILFQFNGDTGSNYNEERLGGYSSTTYAIRNTGQAFITGFPTRSTSNIFGGGAVLIPHAFNTANHKSMLNVAGDVENQVEVNAGRWASTAALTSILLYHDSAIKIGAGSVFKLCVVDEDYRYHATDGEVILGSDGTFTFDGLPDNAGDISFIGYLRGALVGTTMNMLMNLNDDVTDANYTEQHLQGWIGSPGAARGTNRLVGATLGDAVTTNAFTPYISTIQQHAIGDNDPHALHISGGHEDSSVSFVRVVSTRRNNIEKVTKAAFTVSAGTTTWKSGSMMSAYHVPKVLLQRQRIGSGGVAAVTFTLSDLTIPANVKDLRVNWYAALEDGGAGGLFLRMRHNGDTTEANYARALLEGASTTAAVYTSDNSFIGLTTSLDDDGANIFGGGSILIPQYAATDRHKHRLSVGGAAGLTADVLSSRWKSTAAIATIVIESTGGDDIAKGSVFELEGIGNLGSWTGTMSGVDDPEKVMGVEAANIEKIMGIASVALAAWTTTTSISTSRDRRQTAGAGGEGDHVIMGGFDESNRVSYTDEWNGSSWSTSGAMDGATSTGHAQYGSAGTGSSDAAAFGGWSYANNTHEYNGTSWSAGGNLATGRQGITGCGVSSSAALSVGGQTAGAEAIANTEEYNGTSWSSGGAYPSVIQASSCTGIVTAAVAAYGANLSASVATSAEYNGTSWSSGATGTLIVGQDPQAWGASYDNSHFSGTHPNKYGHESYNGTSFSSETSHSTGRTGGSSGGGARAGFVASGSGPSAITPTCEKWT